MTGLSPRKQLKLAMARARLAGVHKTWIEMFVYEPPFAAGDVEEGIKYVAWLEREVEAERAQGRRSHYEDAPPRG